MVAKSSSVLQGVSAGMQNLNLTKKRGIYHVEVWNIFSN